MLTASLSTKRFMKVMNSSLPPNLKQSAVFLSNILKTQNRRTICIGKDQNTQEVKMNAILTEQHKGKGTCVFLMPSQP